MEAPEDEDEARHGLCKGAERVSKGTGGMASGRRGHQRCGWQHGCSGGDATREDDVDVGEMMVQACGRWLVWRQWFGGRCVVWQRGSSGGSRGKGAMAAWCYSGGDRTQAVVQLSVDAMWYNILDTT